MAALLIFGLFAFVTGGFIFTVLGYMLGFVLGILFFSTLYSIKFSIWVIRKVGVRYVQNEQRLND